MTDRELREEGVAPPPPGEEGTARPAGKGQGEAPPASLPASGGTPYEAPDSGEIEWAGGLIKRRPAGPDGDETNG